jgi:hypothetical protein
MPSGLAEGLGHLRHLGLLGQRLDDMPSGHLDSSDTHSYWLDDMPSGHLDYSDSLGHLSHLGYLNILDPKLIDIPLHTFIQEEEDP